MSNLTTAATSNQAASLSLDPKLVELAVKAQENLVNFRSCLLQNEPDQAESPWYHYEWSEVLINSEGNFAFEAFRESAKGQYVVRSFPLYALRFPSTKRDYIVIVKQNATLAENKLLEIEREYTTNPALRSNIIKIRRQSGKVFDVDVLDAATGQVINVLIEAYGKEAGLRGLSSLDRRPKIILIDDPQDKIDARSPTTLENDWDRFVGDIKFLKKDIRIFLIGNNLGEQCLIERVIANADQLGFKWCRIGALNEQGEANWPGKFSKEFLEMERENYRQMGELDVWEMERMCVATSAETRVINIKDFPRFSGLYIDSLLADAKIFITADTAYSKAITSCFRAFCVNGVKPDNRWFIPEISYGRWMPDKWMDELFRLVLEYRAISKHRVEVGIERTEFLGTIEPFLRLEMQRRDIFFDVVPIEHAAEGSKLERIKMLGPRVKAHQIWIPEQGYWLAEFESEINGVTKDALKCMFSDLIDALAMQGQIARAASTAQSSQAASGTPTLKNRNYNPLHPHAQGAQPDNGVTVVRRSPMDGRPQ